YGNNNQPVFVNETIRLTDALDHLHNVMRCMAYAGGFVSLFIFLGALAAQLAILNLAALWAHTQGQCIAHAEARNTKLVPWPLMVGGGRADIHLIGAVAPLAIPLVFCFAWLFIELFRL